MSSPSYPRRRDPAKIAGAVIIVAILAVASLLIVDWMGRETEPVVLRVYTYDSFMVWGDDPATIDNRTFDAFEEQYGVEVRIERLTTDANGIVSRLVAEAANPVADVVIGIDNILILQEEAKSVLTPFTPSNLNLINDTLVNLLDPQHHVVPFDFGLVTVIFDSIEINATTNPELDALTFSDLATPELASALVTENPFFSSPGLAFLLSEIAFQEKLLGQDWEDWWSAVKDDINIQPGWSEAWEVWDLDPERKLLVSYGTDPAYSSWWSGEAPTTSVAPYHHDGNDYAWLQIEGIGLVKNGPNPTIARAFIEYCLTSAVQENIATNQWMFPANMDVTLHPAFDYALHPDDVSPLNDLLSAAEIAANLTTWLDEWENIITSW
ncbi:MAG: thiamine ABC transporter substrate-binding protein [Candidatus Thorarchaeota archaeon]|nr:MAG: thiamine ABC transporter substrate-binding protein [Candidatus Thorarchaeota archaeon]